MVEGGQEGLQQFGDNAVKKYTYNDDQKLSEGVIKSALMGGILGGGAGSISGAINNRVQNPYNDNIGGFSAKTPNEGFANSGNQQTVAQLGNTKVELGDYGLNSQARKVQAGKPDRFSASELPNTLNNVVAAYNSGDSSFRKDNMVLISQMPDGERRAVYTRKNANGNEEIINWHKISAPEYESSLKSYGTPAWNRTRDFGLEHLAENPSHRSIGGVRDSLATSESSLHSDTTIPKTTQEVNQTLDARGDYQTPRLKTDVRELSPEGRQINDNLIRINQGLASGELDQAQAVRMAETLVSHKPDKSVRVNDQGQVVVQDDVVRYKAAKMQDEQGDYI